MRPTTPASARFCDGLSAAGVIVSTTGHLTTPWSAYLCSVMSSMRPGFAFAFSVTPNVAIAPEASDPPDHVAVAPSTVPVQPSTGCACSIASPGGAVTANSIIGSTRSFGASNEIDSELWLDRYAGEAMTCAAAG